MSSDSLTQFVNFKKILKAEKAPYPFIIMNTSRNNKASVHWWSVLNIDPINELLLLDSEVLKALNFLFYLTMKDYLINYCMMFINLIKKIIKPIW